MPWGRRRKNQGDQLFESQAIRRTSSRKKIQNLARLREYPHWQHRGASSRAGRLSTTQGFGLHGEAGCQPSHHDHRPCSCQYRRAGKLAADRKAQEEGEGQGQQVATRQLQLPPRGCEKKEVEGSRLFVAARVLLSPNCFSIDHACMCLYIALGPTVPTSCFLRPLPPPFAMAGGAREGCPGSGSLHELHCPQSTAKWTPSSNCCGATAWPMSRS